MSQPLDAPCPTITELFWRRAEQAPEAELFSFADDQVVAALDARSTDLPRGITLGELDRRARSVAAHLQARCQPGDRVILLEAPGLDFVVAYLGCLYAGLTAVPMYPPDPARLGRTLPRFQAVAADARPAAMLTTATFLSLRTMLLPVAIGLGETAFFDTRELVEGNEDAFVRRAPPPERLAMLQYTSGSTGTPKGVMLSQENLLANLSSIYVAHRFDRDTRQVSWVPPYHDLGLIAGILTPIYGVYPTLLMSPLSFLKDPNRWLQAMHAFRGTASGGPNFAYDLAVQKFRPETFPALDLSRWSVAINGAEPVRVQTVDRFVSTFGRYGFRREAMLPSYGLAEATLMVSGGVSGTCTPRHVHRAALEKEHRVVELASADEGAREVIGCGAVAPGFDVRVVDPTTHTERRRDEAGELWVRGPSVAQGYWGHAEATQQTFGHTLADTQEGPFLRTGDLGFLLHDELFITGRVKDLVIVRGRNHHPEDIEQTVEVCDPAFRRGCSAVFSVEEGDEDVLVVLQEVTPSPGFDPQAAFAATAAAVAREHGIQLRHLVLLEPRALHKTSSGKISRAANRAAWLDDDLLVLHRAAGEAGAGGDEPQTDTERRLAALWSAALGVTGIQRSTSLASLGADSVQIVDLVQRIQEAFAVPQLTPEVVRSRPGLSELARAIDERDFQLRSLDLGLETWLPFTAAELAGRPLADAPPRRILLTGANGFLGVYLLRELLDRSDADVIALVRAASPEAGKARICAALRTYGLDTRGLERVEVVPADLERPRLGLSQAAFDALGQRVDAIVHNGARVDWVMSYTELRSANVDGTREVLQLAAAGRRKPLHYVSTMFTLNPSRDPTVHQAFFDEDHRSGWHGLENGYAQTKWVAERMVLDAGEMGLDVSVHRMDFVVGDVRSGKLHDTDFLVRLFTDMLGRGQLPVERAELNMVAVDQLAREMTTLMLGDRGQERVFHYLPDSRLSMARLHRLFTSFGHDVEAVPYDTWMEGATADPAGPLFPLIFLLRQYSSALLERWQAHEVRAERTVAQLLRNDPEARANAPGVAEIVFAMVRHLHELGRVPQAPVWAAEQPGGPG